MDSNGIMNTQQDSMPSPANRRKESPAINRNKNVRVIIKVNRSKSINNSDDLIIPNTERNQMSVRVPIPLQRRPFRRSSTTCKGNRSTIPFAIEAPSQQNFNRGKGLDDTDSEDCENSNPRNIFSNSKKSPTSENGGASDKFVTKTYNFDHVIIPNTPNEELNDLILDDYLPTLLQGLNASVILYGSPSPSSNKNSIIDNPTIVCDALRKLSAKVSSLNKKKNEHSLAVWKLSLIRITISITRPSETLSCADDNGIKVIQSNPLVIPKDFEINLKSISQLLDEQRDRSDQICWDECPRHQIYLLNITKNQLNKDSLENNSADGGNLFSRLAIFKLAADDTMPAESCHNEPSTSYDIGQTLVSFWRRSKKVLYSDSVLYRYLKMYGQSPKTTLVSYVNMGKEDFLETLNIIQTSSKIYQTKNIRGRASTRHNEMDDSFSRIKSPKQHRKTGNSTPPTSRRSHRRHNTTVKHVGLLERSNLLFTDSSSEESFQTVIYLNSHHDPRIVNIADLKPKIPGISHGYYPTATTARNSLRCKLFDNNKRVKESSPYDTNPMSTTFGDKHFPDRPDNIPPVVMDDRTTGKAPLVDHSAAVVQNVIRTPDPKNRTLGSGRDKRPSTHIKYNSLNRKTKTGTTNEARDRQELLDKKKLSNISKSQERWIDGPKVPIGRGEVGADHGPALDVVAGISFNVAHEARLKEMWIDGPYSPDFLYNIQTKAKAIKNKTSDLSREVDKVADTRSGAVKDLVSRDVSEEVIHTTTADSWSGTGAKYHSPLKVTGNGVVPDLERNILELMNIGNELEDMFQKHKDLEDAIDSNFEEDSLSDAVNTMTYTLRNESFKARSCRTKMTATAHHYDYGDIKFPIISKFGDTVCVGGHATISKHDAVVKVEKSADLKGVLQSQGYETSVTDKSKPVMKVDPFVIPLGARGGNISSCTATTLPADPVGGRNAVLSTFCSPRKNDRPPFNGGAAKTGAPGNVLVENDIYFSKPPLPPRSLTSSTRLYLMTNYGRRPSFVSTILNRSQDCSSGVGVMDKAMTLQAKCRRINQYNCFNFNFNLHDSSVSKEGPSQNGPTSHVHHGGIHLPKGGVRDLFLGGDNYTNNTSSCNSLDNLCKGVRQLNPKEPKMTIDISDIPQFHCLRNSLSCSCFTDHLITGSLDKSLDDTHNFGRGEELYWTLEPIRYPDGNILGSKNQGQVNLSAPTKLLSEEKLKLTTFGQPSLFTTSKFINDEVLGGGGAIDIKQGIRQPTSYHEFKDGGGVDCPKDSFVCRGDGSSGYESSPNRTSIDLDNTNDVAAVVKQYSIIPRCLKMNLERYREPSGEDCGNIYETMDTTTDTIRSSPHPSSQQMNKVTIETFVTNGGNGCANVVHRKACEAASLDHGAKEICHKYPLWSKLFCC